MNIQERLEKFAKWTINNVEHGIYIPLPSPEITQQIKKDILELIGEDEEYDDYGGIAINRDAYEPIIRNQLKSELRLKLKEYMSIEK